MYAAHPRMRGEGNVQKDKQQTKKKVRKIATHSQSKFRTALNSECDPQNFAADKSMSFCSRAEQSPPTQILCSSPSLFRRVYMVFYYFRFFYLSFLGAAWRVRA